MKRPAIFFDRDNTLIACDDYLGDPEKVQLVPGAAEAVARARELGFATVVISNQSGVARGLFDEAAVHAVNGKLDEMLQDENARAIIDRHEFCPYHPQASITRYRQESVRRKPSPGMIYSAGDALALDLERSWLIGDAPRDIEAGKTAGCRTILVCDPKLNKSPAALESAAVQPDYTVTTLKEAMAFIEAQDRPAIAPAPEPAPPIESPKENAEPPQEPAAIPPEISAEQDQKEQEPPQAPQVLSEPERQSDESPQKPPVRVDLDEDEAGDFTEVKIGSSRFIDALPSGQTTPFAQSPPLQRTAEPFGPLQVSARKLEALTEEILRELKRREEVSSEDFSVSKLLAGIAQMIVLALLLLSYSYRNDPQLLALLMLAATLQTMTVALLIMGRQR